MVNRADTSKPDAAAFDATVTRMRSMGIDPLAVGVRHREKTGQLPPNVDIVGKKPRGSHNSMAVGDQEGTVVLTNGISMPVLTVFDATGSTWYLYKDMYDAAKNLWASLEGLRSRYNPQLATGIITDRYYQHALGLPPLEVTQFEGDFRSADQIGELVSPQGEGNDTLEEDYELALFYAARMIETDIVDFYGLRGHMALILDEAGRGSINASEVKTYLGHSLDMGTLSTGQIWEELLTKWWPFIVQVSGKRSTTSWWEERIGKGWIVQVDDPRLIADTIAGLIYVTEAENPDLKGLAKFMQGGKDGPKAAKNDMGKLNEVWRMLHQVEVHFGAQSRLANYWTIPTPGSVFSHYRDPWPIGHPRQSENPTRPADQTAS